LARVACSWEKVAIRGMGAHVEIRLLHVRMVLSVSYRHPGELEYRRVTVCGQQRGADGLLHERGLGVLGGWHTAG
jgi:hypothetical protein